MSSVLTVSACGSGGSSDKPSSVVQADNGEAAKTGPQVMKDAAAAMTAAGAVHVTGFGTEGKPPQKLTMDGHLQTEGMSMSARLATGEEDVIAINGAVYTRGFGSFASDSLLPAALEKTLRNRWIKFGGSSSDSSSSAGSSSDSSSESFSFTSDDESDTTTMAGLAQSFAKPGDGVTIDSKVARGTLSGQPVVIVTESNGASFKVAATGTPYVLQAVVLGDKDGDTTDDDEGPGTLTFSDYGKRVTITAPNDAVDLQQLFKENPKALLPSSLPTDFPTDFPTEVPSS